MNRLMRNRCISTLKGIACILIVLIHCKFPGTLGELVVAIARPAVFYFFVVSGYFVYSADETKFISKVRKQSTKVVRLTIICFIVSFFWRILYALIGDAWDVQGVIRGIFNAKKIFRMFVFQMDIVLGPFWFLLSLILCYLAVYLLRKARLIFICPALIVITLVLNVYLSEICANVQNYYYRNFWLTGFPFYMIGYILHQNWTGIEEKLNDSILKAVIIIGIVSTYLEYMLVGRSLIYIGSIILVISCFGYAIKNPEKSVPFLEYIGDRLSMYMYCCHWFVIEALSTVFNRLGVLEMKGFAYLFPLLSVACSLAVSLLINMVSIRFSIKRKVRTKV